MLKNSEISGFIEHIKTILFQDKEEIPINLLRDKIQLEEKDIELICKILLIIV